MKSKTIFLGTAATAIALSAATVSVSPAQALSISAGSVLNISGNVRANPDNNTPTQLQFIGNLVNNQTTVGLSDSGSFAGLNGTTASIQNLSLTSIGGGFFKSGPVKNFITGIGPSAISLDLADFIYNQVNAEATFSGLFKSGTDSIGATGGFFTTQLNRTNPSTYSASITAVPTPALLPGLIGMGVAAWRKRKGESAKQVEA